MSDSEQTKVEVELFPSEGSDIQFRTVMLGHQAVALLEVDVDDDDEVTFKLTGSLIDSLEELVELVESFATVARAALDQQGAREGS